MRNRWVLLAAVLLLPILASAAFGAWRTVRAIVDSRESFRAEDEQRVGSLQGEVRVLEKRLRETRVEAVARIWEERLRERRRALAAAEAKQLARRPVFGVGVGAGEIPPIALILVLAPLSAIALLGLAERRANLARGVASAVVVCSICTCLWPMLLPGQGGYLAVAQSLRSYMGLSDVILMLAYPVSAAMSLLLWPVVFVIELVIWLRCGAQLDPYLRSAPAVPAVERELAEGLPLGVRSLQRRPMMLLVVGLATMLWPTTELTYFRVAAEAVERARTSGEDVETEASLVQTNAMRPRGSFVLAAVPGGWIVLTGLYGLVRRRCPGKRGLFFAYLDVKGHSAARSALGGRVVDPELERLRRLADVLAARLGGYPAKPMEGDNGLYFFPWGSAWLRRSVWEVPALRFCGLLAGAIQARLTVDPFWQPVVRLVVGFDWIRTIFPPGAWHSDEINRICKAHVEPGSIWVTDAAWTAALLLPAREGEIRDALKDQDPERLHEIDPEEVNPEEVRRGDEESLSRRAPLEVTRTPLSAANRKDSWIGAGICLVPALLLAAGAVWIGAVGTRRSGQGIDEQRKADADLARVQREYSVLQRKGEDGNRAELEQKREELASLERRVRDVSVQREVLVPLLLNVLSFGLSVISFLLLVGVFDGIRAACGTTAPVAAWERHKWLLNWQGFGAFIFVLGAERTASAKFADLAEGPGSPTWGWLWFPFVFGVAVPGLLSCLLARSQRQQVAR